MIFVVKHRVIYMVPLLRLLLGLLLSSSIQLATSFIIKPPNIQISKTSRITFTPATIIRSIKPLDSTTESTEAQTPEEVAFEKALHQMTSFSNKYNQNQGTKYCEDMSIPAVVIKGLAEHKVTLGAPLCPCRFYDDKEKEAKDGFWNCPCVPMRERKECHCMLFLTDDNSFVGEENYISEEAVHTFTDNM